MASSQSGSDGTTDQAEAVPYPVFVLKPTESQSNGKKRIKKLNRNFGNRISLNFDVTLGNNSNGNGGVSQG